MPPKTKITKEMILDAAFEIVRKSGHEALNTRSLAEKLTCSTQPILYQFRSMEEIRYTTYKTADAYHTRYIMQGVDVSDSPLLSIGLAYIRFGYEEKNLFCFLFQTNHFSGSSLDLLLDDPEAMPLIMACRKTFNCSEAEAKVKFRTLFVTVHGYASLLANNGMKYDEKESVQMLKLVYEGLKGD